MQNPANKSKSIKQRTTKTTQAKISNKAYISSNPTQSKNKKQRRSKKIKRKYSKWNLPHYDETR